MSQASAANMSGARLRNLSRVMVAIIIATVLCWLIVLGSARAQSDDTPAFQGLPPAPDYVPGTVITPSPKITPAPKAVAERAPERKRERQRRDDPPGAVDAVWRKLVPHLPAPGDFAIVPGSELRPHLVGKNEFDFCEDIKCHRSGAVLGAWNGAALDAARGQFRVHGGGHGDYGGNEVYVFDFPTLSWTRETDPQPLTGPFLRDIDGDGEGDICPAPASGPPATHTYQGFLYVPKIDRYWLFGNSEYCADGMGRKSAWEYDHHSRTWAAMPELDRYTSHARAVIDPATGNVILHVGRKSQWHEIDPTSRDVVQSFTRDTFGSYIDGATVFDPRDRIIYAIIGGGTTDRLVAYRWPDPSSLAGNTLSGRLIADWPSGKTDWGMAQHSSGLLVLWDGYDQIVTVDPQTGQSRELATGGEAYLSRRGSGKSARVYSKWAYVPSLDAFFGITDPDIGIVLYRLGGEAPSHAGPRPSRRADSVAPETAQAPTDRPKRPSSRSLPDFGGARTVLAAGSESRPTPPSASRPTDGGWAAPLEVQATASWQEVCSEAVLCDPMGYGEVLFRGAVVESGPPKRARNWRSIRQKFEHPEAREPAADPEVGGLRFDFPSHSEAGTSGMFKTNFSPDYSFQVGPPGSGAPAEEVFIQFQVRYSCTFIWTDCDPQSPNYRAERRCFRSKGRGDDCTASKIALIATGDREGSIANACTRIQTAINHGSDHYLTGFHRCPRTRGLSEVLPKIGGRANYDAQPNGRYYCPRIMSDGGKRRWNNSSDTCFRLVDDRWITIQVRLRFGPWQEKPGKDDPKLSHISIWAGIEGEHGGRQLLVIDNDFHAMEPHDPRDFVGKIWLMPHLYRKSPEEDHPPFHVWYRNLVISEKLIPNPKSDS